MRTEKGIVKDILAIANSDNDVKAVIQTYDVPPKKYTNNLFYFIVANIEKYDNDKLYENVLGERILLFRGDKNYPEMHYGSKAHLMVFKDGSTIVINAMTIVMFMERYHVYEKGKPFKNY